MDPLLDHAPCGFLSFDDEGIIVRANATLCTMLAYERGELIGRKLEVILSLATGIFYQTHFFPLLKLHGKAEEIFLAFRPKSGPDLPVIANAVRRADEGVSDCVIITVHQRQKYEQEILAAKRAAEEALRSNEELIRAKKELEAHTLTLDRKLHEVEQKNRDLRRVSQILFHDLREPLRKIFAFEKLLRDESDLVNPQGRAYLERIEAASRRMGRLLSALQEFASVESLQDVLGQVDLSASVASAAKRASLAHAIEISYEAEPLPCVEGYARRLELLFFHLFANAIRYRRVEEPPRVVIQNAIVQHNLFAALKNRYRYVDFVKITFRDNSIGFDNKSETSFQLLGKQSEAGAGLGTGLAICRKVVESHYGSISVRSSRGSGAEYTILLPLEQSRDNSSPAS